MEEMTARKQLQPSYSRCERQYLELQMLTSPRKARRSTARKRRSTEVAARVGVTARRRARNAVAVQVRVVRVLALRQAVVAAAVILTLRRANTNTSINTRRRTRRRIRASTGTRKPSLGQDRERVTTSQ